MDIKLIMPTVLILIFTLFVMVTVIPYAFSSVIKQLQGVWALEEQSKIAGRNYIAISLFSVEAEAALRAGTEATGVSNPDVEEIIEETTPCSC